jgi:hypothetical protein
MDWYVLHRHGRDASIARAPSEEAAMQVARDLFRRGALIEEIGRFLGRRRKVALGGLAAMECMRALAGRKAPCE